MEKEKINNCTGWICDLPDQRDYEFSTRLYLKNLKLPAKVNLEKRCSPVENQGALGSCTAQSAVGALEYLSNKAGHAKRNFSKLYVYFNTRLINHAENFDSGATLRDTVKSLADHGACREKLWPYFTPYFRNKPPDAAYADGMEHQVLSYYRMYTIDEFKNCLVQGYPFVFGFPVYESFMGPEVAKTGVVPYPGMNERLRGGHAVMAVGYDDAKQRFRVRNSWGTTWGQKGYFEMPYEYMANMGRDFWTIRAFEKP